MPAVVGVDAATGPTPTHAAEAEGCLAVEGLDDPGDRLPVVLVHGFRSGPHKFDHLAGQLDPARFAVSQFDYQAHNTDWVDHPEIGPKLRRTIVCLADVSAQAGGPARVGVVGHSMGGLATRHAVGGDAELASRIAVVATLGTPNDGSEPADPTTAVGAVAWVIDQALGGLIFEFDTPAAAAMRPGNAGQLGFLPDLPDEVPVWAAAGEYVAEPRLFLYAGEVRAGDGIVSVPSATSRANTAGGLGGVDVAECRIPVALDIAALTGGRGAVALIQWAFRNDPRLRDCAHTRLPYADQLTTPIVTQLVAAARTEPEPTADGGGDAVTDPLELLNTFLSAWHRQDRAAMAKLAAPEAIAKFEQSPEGVESFHVSWDPFSCLMGSSAAGGCTIALISPEGGGFMWDVYYMEVDASGQLMIYDVSPIGGGM